MTEDIIKIGDKVRMTATGIMESTEAMEGIWTLTAPDDRKWYGNSPLECCRKELHERVPPKIRLERMKDFLLKRN